MTANDFLSAFTNPIPIFAMLHLKGGSSPEKLDIARRETEILWSSGIDAVIVENYFGSTDDVVAMCQWLKDKAPEVVFGVNILKDDKRAFEVANAFGARFIQLDSVSGHLTIEADVEFGDWLNQERARSDAFVLGGVRFKYQPYLSGRPLTEDLVIGKSRCDAVVVTGEGTGLQTPSDKTAQFRAILGPEFPIVIGAGVTPESAARDLANANAVIVGSYLKDSHVDTGDVDRDHTLHFVRAIRALGAQRTISRN
ncbi:BtpA/SgcQ family protein [Taklimakanibacter deserti]|uniref:BtpA/SgcQ family protein n=1 Tax=Taklimakanibacter deserti TaxID=2267839 RepID=UPI000E646E88